MNEDERIVVNDLIRASIFDIVRPGEIDRFMEDGIFTHREDVANVYENAKTKIDNLKASPDNAKHMFLPLPNDYSVPCINILEEIGLTKRLCHALPTNPTNEKNISPVEGC
eukprot:14430732-Ditylum_brightwellii.AAC.1